VDDRERRVLEHQERIDAAIEEGLCPPPQGPRPEDMLCDECVMAPVAARGLCKTCYNRHYMRAARRKHYLRRVREGKIKKAQ